VEIHEHVRALQDRFLAGLADRRVHALPERALTPSPGLPRGNFLTFDLADAASVHARLTDAKIVVDRRGRRLRFGFGVYHDAAFVDRLLDRVEAALA
jgi:selenocysteine lyase/cysteine desulfurase